jgi:hypothetical protein
MYTVQKKFFHITGLQADMIIKYQECEISTHDKNETFVCKVNKSVRLYTHMNTNTSVKIMKT